MYLEYSFGTMTALNNSGLDSECAFSVSRGDLPAHYFWDFVDVGRSSQCWDFLGKKYHGGYGLFRWEGLEVRAHRFALALTKGLPPEGKPLALHSCDRPLCCNPNHLRWGTQKENMQDASRRGRIPGNRRGKPFSYAQTKQIKPLQLPYETPVETNRSKRRMRRRKGWQPSEAALSRACEEGGCRDVLGD